MASYPESADEKLFRLEPVEKSDRGSVVITGVSSGIGFDAARHLLDQGFDVFGSVRTTADAERVSAALGARFTPLQFDVTDPVAVARAAHTVRCQLGGRRLTGLINNAGIANGGPLAVMPLGEIRALLEVNVLGVISVIQAFAPLLGTDPALHGAPGRIINISSIGGKLAFPFMGGYSASKFALEALSDSLRREMKLFGVPVVIVAPHSVLTPMLDKAEAQDRSRYDGTRYAEPGARIFRAIVTEGRRGLRVEQVSDSILEALTADPPRPRYRVERNPILGWLLAFVLPVRWVDAIMARQFALSGPA